MPIPGHVQNGVAVLHEGATRPEGTGDVVSQLSPVDQERQPETKLAAWPLVSSGKPGSIHLTNERIHELLDEEDIEAMTRTWLAPS
jgi:hypothetical protein